MCGVTIVNIYLTEKQRKMKKKWIFLALYKLTCTIPEISISPTSNPFAPYPSESGIDATWEEMGRIRCQ